MNRAVLAMMPKMIGNSTQQSNQPTASSTAKFDDVLTSTLSSHSKIAEPNSTNTELTSEQKKAVEDLLAFLKTDSFSEMGDGNVIAEHFGEVHAVLQVLMKVHEEDESAVAEFLTSILHNGLASIERELANNEDEDQDVNQLLLEVTPNLYDAITKLNALETEELVKLDINGMGNILKLVKLQDIASSQQELSQDVLVFQKEIQNLLESISSKLEKWLGSQPTKAGHEPTAAMLLENKTLDTVRNAYARMFTAEDEKNNESISNGLTLKTAESHPQSSGLPFPMTKLEQYVLTASKNGQAVDAEQFVKFFENILSKANFSNANGIQKLLIRLNPEHLGSLRIELIQKDGAITAKILATTAQVKELLDRQVQGLKQAFTNQTILVEKIEISQQISTFNAERFAPRDQGQQEQRQSQSQYPEQNDEEETNFTEDFEEVLLNLKV